jgi:hypothetical protein
MGGGEGTRGGLSSVLKLFLVTLFTIPKDGDELVAQATPSPREPVPIAANDFEVGK